MVEIRPSRPEETAEQKALWRAAFGDGEAYIDWFYTCFPRGEHMLLLLEDGKLASMTALLPHLLTLPGGAQVQAYYVYALATDPAVRSKGYGRQLLHCADGYLKRRGADCVTVVPAEAGLFRFFGMADFQNAFYTRKLELLRENCPPAQAEDGAEPISPRAYDELREKLLAGVPAVHYGETLIRYQQGMCRLSGGELYRVRVGGVQGCAAVEYADRESVLFKELLLPPEQMCRGLAALAPLCPGRRCYVRTPACWDGMQGSYIQPFGMIKWLRPELAGAWKEDTPGYLGLGFD